VADRPLQRVHSSNSNLSKTSTPQLPCPAFIARHPATELPVPGYGLGFPGSELPFPGPIVGFHGRELPLGISIAGKAGSIACQPAFEVECCLIIQKSATPKRE